MSVSSPIFLQTHADVHSQFYKLSFLTVTWITYLLTTESIFSLTPTANGKFRFSLLFGLVVCTAIFALFLEFSFLTFWVFLLFCFFFADKQKSKIETRCQVQPPLVKPQTLRYYHDNCYHPAQDHLNTLSCHYSMAINVALQWPGRQRQ